MRQLFRIVVFLAVAVPTLQAQQPGYEDLSTYKEALELFDKGKYVTAQQKFGQFVARNHASSYAPGRNDLIAEAHYYQGVCAFHLLHDNASAMLEEYIAEFPEHSRHSEAYFCIGKMRYIRKDYKGAVAPLRKIESGTLDKEQKTEARFMLGYGYYADGQHREAMSKFRQIRQSPGLYGEMGAYYLAVIAYDNGNYAEAYTAMQRVDPDAKYAKNLDLMKASCLLALKRYDELDQMGEELIKNSRRAGAETWFILGNAAFDRDKYAQCIEYFKKFEGQRGRLNREGQYRMGYSYYRSGNYREAMARLDKALQPEDKVAQNAYYYLGHSFLKVEKFENARTAFSKASDLKFDQDLTAEAMFQYAKASFETRYFEDALAALQTFIRDYPESSYIEEAQSLVGEVLLYTNNYKDAIEYLENSAGLRTRRAQEAYQRACYYYALSMYEKRKYEIAADYFKRSLNQRHDAEITLSSYYWYAESQFRMQDFAEATSSYRNFLDQSYASKHPNYALAWYGIGWALLKQKKYDQAGRNFEKFIGLADRDANREQYVDAVLRAGDCEFAGKNFNGALRYYRQVQDFNNMHVDYALFQTGHCFFRLEDYNKSAGAWVRLAARYAKSEFRDDALIQAAETYLTWLDDWRNCAKYCRVLIRDHEDSKFVPGALTRLAIAEAKSGNNPSAIRYFKQVAYDHCYDASARNTSLQALSDLLPSREYDQVEAQSRKNCPITAESGGSGESEDLAINIADQRFVFDEDFASAAQRYSNYLVDFPRGRYVDHAHFFLGQSYQKLGEPEKALVEYEAVFKQDAPSEYTLKALNAAADIQFAKGNNLVAMELYTAMEERSDKLEDRLGAQFGKAKINLANEDYPAARRELLAIRNDPNTTEYSRTKAKVQLAVCDYFLGSLDEAFTVFSEVEKDYSNVFAAESQYYITRILYDRGDFEQSRIAAIYLKDEYPGYNYWKARAFLVLAEAYLELGDTLQATDGTLLSLAKQDVYLEIQEQAKRRLEEIKAMRDLDNAGGVPDSEEDNNDVGNLIEEEN